MVQQVLLWDCVHAWGHLSTMGHLVSKGKIIKNKSKIVVLWQAILKLAKVSIIHCPGHKTGEDPMASGNCLVDWGAGKGSSDERKTILLTNHHSGEESPDRNLRNGWPPPGYPNHELKLIKGCPTNYLDKYWHWKTLEGKTILPEHQALELLTQMHRYTHLGSRKLEQVIKRLSVFI